MHEVCAMQLWLPMTCREHAPDAFCQCLLGPTLFQGFDIAMTGTSTVIACLVKTSARALVI